MQFQVALLSVRDGMHDYPQSVLLAIKPGVSPEVIAEDVASAHLGSAADREPGDSREVRLTGTVPVSLEEARGLVKFLPLAGASQQEVESCLTGVYEDLEGTGYIFEVPVTVDTTMTGRVRVRAMDRDTAIEKARELASNGQVQMNVDEGNYRSMGDYYCPDRESIEASVPAGLVSEDPDAERVQVGAYVVEWHPQSGSFELVILDPENPVDPIEAWDQKIPEGESPVGYGASACKALAQMLDTAAPDPKVLDEEAIGNAFCDSVAASLNSITVEGIAGALADSYEAALRGSETDRPRA